MALVAQGVEMVHTLACMATWLHRKQQFVHSHPLEDANDLAQWILGREIK